MSIELSETLIRAAGDAARKLSGEKEEIVFLEKPWGHFSVSMTAPADAKTLFKVFSGNELGLDTMKDIYLLCSDILGN